MPDLSALADTLIANFRTVQITAPEPIETRPGDFFAPVRVRLAERRAIQAFRDKIRRGLAQRGHRFLHHLEDDPEGGCRLHIFLADVDEIVAGASCRGDPLDFDPREFIRERLPECWWVEEWL